MLLFLLQIGDLFNGKFTWRGVIQLALFITALLIIISLSVFFIRLVVKESKKK